MINMQLTKAEAKEECGVASADYDLPRFPYGLSISLDDEVLEKLGIKDLPKVGAVMLLQAQVTVTSVSSRATQDSKEKGEPTESTSSDVSLQITDMELQGAARDLASQLYSKK